MAKLTVYHRSAHVQRRIVAWLVQRKSCVAMLESNQVAMTAWVAASYGQTAFYSFMVALWSRETKLVDVEVGVSII